MSTPKPQKPELVEIRPGMRTKPRPVRGVARLAATQDGVVGHAQLLALGLSISWIKRQVDQGWLHIVFRGAYAVGHKRLTWRGRLRAAILSCGPRALISHRTAAALQGLRRSSSAVIHVTVPPGGREDRQQGIVLHRIRNMRDVEHDTVDGIPCTSVARTCLDMAAILRRDSLDSLLEQAERNDALDVAAFLAVCKRGRKGSRALKRALSIYRPLPGWTRSRLERRAFSLLETAGITPDGVNVWVDDAAVECDLVFYEQKLVIEIDGGATHGTTAAKLRDPQRDAKLQIAGYAVLRVPEHRLVHAPGAYLDDATALLSRAARTRARPGR
jgi:hypothetical protein